MDQNLTGCAVTAEKMSPVTWIGAGIALTLALMGGITYSFFPIVDKVREGVTPPILNCTVVAFADPGPIMFISPGYYFNTAEVEVAVEGSGGTTYTVQSADCGVEDRCFLHCADVYAPGQIIACWWQHAQTLWIARNYRMATMSRQTDSSPFIGLLIVAAIVQAGLLVLVICLVVMVCRRKDRLATDEATAPTRLPSHAADQYTEIN